MASKQLYNIVGRYINEEDARDVVGYHLQSVDGQKSARYSIEQVAFLVGRDQVLNCAVQLYKDKVLFRGKNTSLDNLPTQRIRVIKPNRVGSRQVNNIHIINKPRVEQPKVEQPKVEQPRVEQPKVSKNYKELADKLALVFERKYNLTTIDDTDNENASQRILDGEANNHRLSVEATVYGNMRVRTVIKIDIFNSFSETFTQGNIKEYIRNIFDKIDSMLLSVNIAKDKLKRFYSHNYIVEALRCTDVELLLESLNELVPENDIINIYNKAINEIMRQSLELAYKLDNSSFKVFDSDAINIKINIDGKEGKLYYISTNIWGFDPDTKISKQREKMIVSESTMYLLNKMFKHKITQIGFRDNQSNYKRVHYHDVIVRIREFRYIHEFKWLKIHYLKINDEVFENKLSPEILLTAYNYGAVDTQTENSGFSAFHWSCGNRISFNGRYSNLQGKQLSKNDRCTIIHEMCHEYADICLGGTRESLRENWGDVLYGMDKKYGNQLQSHGLNFGKAVEFATLHCEFIFEDIFGYGLQKHNFEYGTSRKETTDISGYNSTSFDGYNNVNRIDLRQWYNYNIPYMINKLQQIIKLQNQNCDVKIMQEQDTKYLQREKNMMPIGIYITSYDGTTFNEKYKITIEITNRGNFRFKVFRDYIEQYKGYLLGEETINAQKFAQNDFDKAINSMGNKIVKDLIDA